MSSIPAFPEALAPCELLQNVCWLEQTEVDVPAGNDWLSAYEVACLGRLRFAKRRADWRLGRWTAKRAIAACLNLTSDSHTLAAIEIRAASSGSPELLLSGRPAPIVVSLSHSAGVAICALASGRATASDTSLGCDVEAVELRSDAFIGDYFTASEQALTQQTPAEKRPLLVTVLWSAKESALKALREGLRLDTRSVEVSLGSAFQQQSKKCSGSSFPAPPLTLAGIWHPLQVRHESGPAFHGWWCHNDQFVRTIVSRPPARLPIHVSEIGTSEGFNPQLTIPAIRP